MLHPQTVRVRVGNLGVPREVGQTARVAEQMRDSDGSLGRSVWTGLLGHIISPQNHDVFELRNVLRHWVIDAQFALLNELQSGDLSFF